MRIGINPQKNQPILKAQYDHRVIIVVYLTDSHEFYKNSLDVVTLAIESLIATVPATTAITLVNNGSYPEATELLEGYWKKGKIDCLISHKTNIGKVDALLGAARSSREKYITLADADVLFKSGWVSKTREIFNAFPKAGSVSLIAYRHTFWHGTSSIMRAILFGLKLKKEPIPENFEDYKRFTDSINLTFSDSPNAPWPVLESRGIKAIMGGTHQVLTIKRELLFTKVPTKPSYILIGKNSVGDFIDDPIDRSGKWRLSTFHNYAYHMGNGLEDWMKQVQEINKTSTPVSGFPLEIETEDLFTSRRKLQFYRFQKRLVRRWFFKVCKIGKHFPKHIIK